MPTNSCPYTEAKGRSQGGRFVPDGAEKKDCRTGWVDMPERRASVKDLSFLLKF